jgi:hypothetical protein
MSDSVSGESTHWLGAWGTCLAPELAQRGRIKAAEGDSRVI